MNKFFDLGNRYAKNSSWIDFALVKFCLFSIGLLVGINLPERFRPCFSLLAIFTFLATYIPLMKKVFKLFSSKPK